jgi:hypothetical protein
MQTARAAAAAAATIAAAWLGDARAADTAGGAGEIRGLAVGVQAATLPTRGLAGIACAATGEALAEGWAGFARCPAAGPDGLREVGVRYDEAAAQPWAAANDAWEGTKLAGHPVLLSVLVADDGTVEAVRAVTDPEARLFHKKKAYLLGIRVMGRYGRDGWACADDPPAEGRTPVGGMLIARTCAKDLGDRRLVLRTDLYRAPGQEGREFTDATRFEIWRRAPDAG